MRVHNTTQVTQYCERRERKYFFTIVKWNAILVVNISGTWLELPASSRHMWCYTGEASFCEPTFTSECTALKFWGVNLSMLFTFYCPTVSNTRFFMYALHGSTSKSWCIITYLPCRLPWIRHCSIIWVSVFTLPISYSQHHVLYLTVPYCLNEKSWHQT